MIASSFKRFLSYIVDFSILAIVTSLLSNVIYVLIGVPNFNNDFKTTHNNDLLKNEAVISNMTGSGSSVIGIFKIL